MNATKKQTFLDSFQNTASACCAVVYFDLPKTVQHTFRMKATTCRQAGKQTFLDLFQNTVSACLPTRQACCAVVYFAPTNTRPLCGGDEAGKKEISRQKNELFPLRTKGNPALLCLVGKQARACSLYFVDFLVCLKAIKKNFTCSGK